MRRSRHALAACLLACHAMHAQTETLRLQRYPTQPESECVVADVTAVLAQHGRHGPAGFITCAFENPDAQTHEVTLRIEGYNARVVVRDQVRLEPRQRLTRHYPVQRYGQAPAVILDGDDGSSTRTAHLGGTPTPMGVLLVSPRAEATGELQTALSRMIASASSSPTPAPRSRHSAASGTGPDFGITELRPTGVPPAWQCLAGFDLLVVDGRGEFDAGAEQVLVDAVAAGGAMLVIFARSLGDGPLRRALATSGEIAAGGGQLALGSYFVLDAAPQRTAALAAWLTGDAPRVADHARLRNVSGPAPDELHRALAIPGLGAVPVGAFFVLLTLFAIIAGPINIFWCRRAKRPLLIAATIPLLGFGFAAAILLWGVLAEGLGVRGVVRSLTWLDQRAHVAVNHAASSLFAGLTPSWLAPGPGTLVSTSSFRDEWRSDTPHRYVVDHAAGGRIAGSLLPGRSQTTLVTVSQVRARERLRFRRLRDGNLEALYGPGLVLTAPGVAVRDHAGQCYLGTPQGDGVVLARVEPTAVRVFLRDARQAFLTVPATQNEPELRYAGMPVHVRVAVPGHQDPQEVLASALLASLSDLAPGTYAAWVSDNAAFDTLGLEVRWDARHHLVLGQLGEDDFVD